MADRKLILTPHAIAIGSDLVRIAQDSNPARAQRLPGAEALAYLTPEAVAAGADLPRLIQSDAKPQSSVAFSPRSIPNLALWMDSNDDSSFTLGYGGTVQSWTDKSNNARQFLPIVAADPSYLVRIRKNKWKGRNVVCPQLTPNTGLVSSSFDIASNFAANGTDITLFAAFRTDEPNFNPASLCFQVLSGSTGLYFRPVNSVGQARFLAAGGSLTGSNAGFLGSENIVVMQRSGSSMKIWLNGALALSGTSAPVAIPAGSMAPMYIGASAAGGGGMHGDLPEWGIYAGAITDAQRVQLEDYLAANLINGVIS